MVVITTHTTVLASSSSGILLQDVAVPALLFPSHYSALTGIILIYLIRFLTVNPAHVVCILNMVRFWAFGNTQHRKSV